MELMKNPEILDENSIANIFYEFSLFSTYRPLGYGDYSSVGRGKAPERPPPEIGIIVVEIWSYTLGGIYFQRGGRTPRKTK